MCSNGCACIVAYIQTCVLIVYILKYTCFVLVHELIKHMTINKIEILNYIVTKMVIITSKKQEKTKKISITRWILTRNNSRFKRLFTFFRINITIIFRWMHHVTKLYVQICNLAHKKLLFTSQIICPFSNFTKFKKSGARYNINQ